ncbi:MAG: RDD family protein [Polyangiaceae bacterium]
MYREAEPRDDEDSGARIARPAEFPVRAAAQVIDLVFGVALGMGVGVITGMALAVVATNGALAVGWETRLGRLDVTGVALGMAGSLLYHTLSAWLGGASVGKWLCGLRVHTAELSLDRTFLRGLHPCTARGALIRSLAIYVDAMLFGAVAYFTMINSGTQARLGDRWARTIVVVAKETRGAQPRSPALGVLAGVAAWAICLALPMILRVL